MFPILVWVEILDDLTIADLLIIRQVSKSLKAMADFMLHQKFKIVNRCRDSKGEDQQGTTHTKTIMSELIR